MRRFSLRNLCLFAPLRWIWEANQPLTAPAVSPLMTCRAARNVNASGGRAMAVSDAAIMQAVADCARDDGLLLCPEGGATLAAYRQALADSTVGADERVVLFNCATGLKYPMPEQTAWLDRTAPIDFEQL